MGLEGGSSKFVQVRFIKLTIRKWPVRSDACLGESVEIALTIGFCLMDTSYQAKNICLSHLLTTRIAASNLSPQYKAQRNYEGEEDGGRRWV